MPIYEYQCAKCDFEFEREQRITDAPVKTCPQCKARRVKKLISQTSFVLKGGGWYSDLYSSSKKESPADAKSDSSASEGKKDDKKGDSTKTPAKSDKPSDGSSAKSGSKSSKKNAA